MIHLYNYYLCELDSVVFEFQNKINEFRKHFDDKEIGLVKKSNENEKIKKDKDVIILFKRLVMYTHPDKNPLFENDFKQINEAYKKNNLVNLLYYALKFDIDFNLIDVENGINLIEEKILELKHDMTNLKNTLAWRWVEGSTAEKRQLESFLEKNYKVKKKIDIYNK